MSFHVYGGRCCVCLCRTVKTVASSLATTSCILGRILLSKNKKQLSSHHHHHNLLLSIRFFIYAHPRYSLVGSPSFLFSLVRFGSLVFSCGLVVIAPDEWTRFICKSSSDHRVGCYQDRYRLCCVWFIPGDCFKLFNLYIYPKPSIHCYHRIPGATHSPIPIPTRHAGPTLVVVFLLANCTVWG